MGIIIHDDDDVQNSIVIRDTSETKCVNGVDSCRELLLLLDWLTRRTRNTHNNIWPNQIDRDTPIGKEIIPQKKCISYIGHESSK